MKFIERKKPSFSVHELLTTKLTDFVFDEFGAVEIFQKDPLYIMVEESIGGTRKLEPIDIARELMFRLHLMGAVEVKISADRPFNWVHLTLRPIKREHIDGESRIEIHPMLWRALGNVVRKEHRS